MDRAIWMRRTIAIRRGDGALLKRLAFVRAPFAVHRCISGEDHWVITHLPTGLNLMSATGWFRTAIEGKRVADAVRLLSPDWETMKPGRKRRSLRRQMRQAAEEALGHPIIEGPVGDTPRDCMPLNGYGSPPPSLQPEGK